MSILADLFGNKGISEFLKDKRLYKLVEEGFDYEEAEHLAWMYGRSVHFKIGGFFLGILLTLSFQKVIKKLLFEHFLIVYKRREFIPITIFSFLIVIKLIREVSFLEIILVQAKGKEEITDFFPLTSQLTITFSAITNKTSCISLLTSNNFKVLNRPFTQFQILRFNQRERNMQSDYRRKWIFNPLIHDPQEFEKRKQRIDNWIGPWQDPKLKKQLEEKSLIVEPFKIKQQIKRNPWLQSIKY